MIRNRIVLGISLLLAGIFASFYGGATVYLLFYTLLLLPIVSLIYTAYVYFRLDFYQEVIQRTVIKEETVPYYFKLVNKDYLSYSHIKLHFYEETSQIQGKELETVYCMLPGDEVKIEGSLCCKYRGQYEVGVKSIEIADFLYLFKINYPVVWKLRLTVLPKVYALHQLQVKTLDEDPKNLQAHLSRGEGFLESEVRKYTGSEARKRIHWKASAKKGELLVRQYTEPKPLSNHILIDLTRVEDGEVGRIRREDCLLTVALSLGKYYQEKHIKYTMHWEQGGLKECSIHNETDFWQFYKKVVDFKFYSDFPVESLLQKSNSADTGHYFYVLTSLLTEKLGETILNCLKRGDEVALLLIAQPLDKENIKLKEILVEHGAKVYSIPNQECLQEVLGA